jgi:hypothetical protein
MAVLNRGDTYPTYAVVHADGEGVPISFLLGNDGLVRVTSLRLILGFGLSEDFMFLDEEVYDALSRDLINTIEQPPVCDGDSKEWVLRPGRFRIYGWSHPTARLQAPFSSPLQHG